MLRHSIKPLVASAQFAKQRASLRALHSSNAILKAQFFQMPAMSPTMEKGGVTDWKFKEGESFSSGDVLLEVETDKAQIDVEAQDDGVIAKILVQNGGKDIPVGTPIAILAEPEDDLATLELPTVDAKPAQKAPKQESKPQPKEQSKPSAKPSPSISSESISVDANPKQVFFPSVASLLSENKISRADAIAKIKATGANGRIVKGDVLAFLGKISQDSVNRISSFIQSHSHLDLSNIEKLKITPKETAKEAAVEAGQPSKSGAKAPKPKPEPKVITKTYDLETLLEFQASASEKGFDSFTIKEYITDASKRAETYAYQTHEQKSDYYDPIFEELVSPSQNTERFQISLDIPIESHIKTIRNPLDAVDFFNEQDDFFDDLTSTVPHSQLTVKVTINPGVLDAEEKATLYLQKLERYLYDLKLTN